MKLSSQALRVVLLAAGINAQTTTVVNDPNDPGTTTVYYSICPSAVETTITLSSTLTYCPGNNCGGGPMITPAPGAGAGGTIPNGPLGTEIIDYTTVGADGQTTHYQVFETVYNQACSSCPEGVALQTFTVTEQCPCMSARPSTYMPLGFNTTVYSCEVCATNGGPTTITLTTPCSTGPYMNQATATGATSIAVLSLGATSVVAGAAGASSSYTPGSGSGTTGAGGVPGTGSWTANGVASKTTPTAVGMGISGSASTINPSTSPMASGSSSGTAFKAAATHVITGLWAVFVAVIGLLACTL